MSVEYTRSSRVTMLLAGGVSGPLTGIVTDGLTVEIGGIRVDTPTNMRMAVEVVVAITLAGVAPLSYALYMWASLCAGAVFVTNVSIIVVRVDMIVDDLIGVFARTAKDVVPEIGTSADADANVWVTMLAVLEITTTPSFRPLLLL